jgi:hypothetical protein
MERLRERKRGRPPSRSSSTRRAKREAPPSIRRWSILLVVPILCLPGIRRLPATVCRVLPARGIGVDGRCLDGDACASPCPLQREKRGRRIADGAAVCHPLTARCVVVIAAPRYVFAVAAILTIAGAAARPWLGESLLPPLREREVVVTEYAAGHVAR